MESITTEDLNKYKPIKAAFQGKVPAIRIETENIQLESKFEPISAMVNPYPPLDVLDPLQHQPRLEAKTSTLSKQIEKQSHSTAFENWRQNHNSIATFALEALKKKHSEAQSTIVKVEDEAKLPINEGWFGVEGFDFHVQKEDKAVTVRLDANSLFIFKGTSKFRQRIVEFSEWVWFQNLILLIIIIQSLMLCLQDNKDRYLGPEYKSVRNGRLELAERVLTGLFTVEAVIQITAKGFVLHNNSYLRDGWNVLDFFVVVISLVSYLPIKVTSVKFFRAFRVLKPLRTIKRAPKMKQLIDTLFKAVKGLFGVLFFLAFVVYLFAIFGLNSFKGRQYYFCRTTLEPSIVRGPDNELLSYNWPIESQFHWLCHSDRDCQNYIEIFGTDQFLDPDQTPVYKCGRSIDFGVKAGGKLDIDNVRKNKNILWDFANFNSVPNSMLTIFQVLTLEKWVDPIMYQYMSSTNKYATSIYFLSLVLLGAFFMMNLFLAQMIFSFDRNLEEEDEESERCVQHSEQQEEEKKDDQRQESKIGQLIFRKPIAPEPKVEVVTSALDESALIDETPDEKEARLRSHENKCYRVFYKLVSFWGFNFFITLMIMLNTACLAADTFDQNTIKEEVLEILGTVFTWMFTAEAILKIIGLGPKCYVRDYYNIFDAFVVILSLVDFAIMVNIATHTDQTAILSAFRSVRLLRIIKPLKLIRRWTSLHEILGKTMRSSRSILDFIALLGIFMFIFSLLGMQLFGNSSFRDMDGNIVLQKDLAVRYKTEVLTPVQESFDNIYISINTIYRIMTGEGDGWSDVMYKNLSPKGKNWGIYSLFFVITRAFCTNVMLSLFTAILCNKFSGRESDEREVKVSNIFKSKSLKEKFKKYADDFFFFFGYRKTVKERKKKRRASQIELDVLELEDQELHLPTIRRSATLVDHQRLAEIDTNRHLRESASPRQMALNKVTPRAATPENDFQPKLQTEESADQAQIVFDKASRSLQPFSQRSQQLMRSMVPSTPLKLARYRGEPLFEHSKEISQQMEEGYSPSRTLGSNGKKLSEADLSDESTASRNIKIPKLKGRSLYIMGPRNAVRKGILKVVSNVWFERGILILILAQIILLALESPLDKPNSIKLKTLDKIDYFMTACFTIEMIVKIVTYGFLFNGKRSYLRSWWNVLDFVVVTAALITLGQSQSLKSFKTLRAIRAIRSIRVLRPLRIISRHYGMRIAIVSLFKSLPNIINLQIIKLFVLCLFGIFFKTLFGGRFQNCSYKHLRASGSLSDHQLTQLIETKWDCLNYGGEWINSDFKFDNIWDSLIGLFSVQFSTLNMTDLDRQPKLWSKQYLIVLVILVDILTNVLFINLFVSIVYETFKGQKTFFYDNKHMQKHKLAWINMQVLAYEAEPMILITQQPQNSWLRNKCIAIISHRHFADFMNFCIISNTVLMCINWYGIPAELLLATDIINVVYIWIFTSANVIKVIAMRTQYFKQNWNLFDLFIVSSSQIILLMKWTNIGNQAIQAIIIAKVIKKINVIFHTLTEAAPSIASLGSLLLLTVFMYAIIGMRLFAFTNVTNQPTINYFSNFQDFFNSFFLLLRAATGEANLIMYDFARGKSILFQCDDHDTHQQEVAVHYKTTNACGSAHLAYPFFLSYFVIVTQIFINLFIAILVDSFIGQTNAAELPVSDADLLQFQKVWSKIDPLATGHMRCNQFDDFLLMLQKEKSPFLSKTLLKQKVDAASEEAKKPEFKKERDRFAVALEIKVFYDWQQAKVEDFPSLTFYETLLSMIKHKFMETFTNKEFPLEMANTIVQLFNFKDKFKFHKGGLQYEDRRVMILKKLRELVEIKISALKRNDDKDNALRHIRSDKVINKQINDFIGYKKLKKKIMKRRVADGEDIDDLSEELEFADFARQFYQCKYRTDHYVAVQKIVRLYREIKAQRIADKEFVEQRLAKINSRKLSNLLQKGLSSNTGKIELDMRNLPAETLDCYAHIQTSLDNFAIKVIADPKTTPFAKMRQISDGEMSEQSQSLEDVINQVPTFFPQKNPELTEDDEDELHERVEDFNTEVFSNVDPPASQPVSVLVPHRSHSVTTLMMANFKLQDSKDLNKTL